MLKYGYLCEKGFPITFNLSFLFLGILKESNLAYLTILMSSKKVSNSLIYSDGLILFTDNSLADMNLKYKMIIENYLVYKTKYRMMWCLIEI